MLVHSSDGRAAESGMGSLRCQRGDRAAPLATRATFKHCRRIAPPCPHLLYCMPGPVCYTVPTAWFQERSEDRDATACRRHTVDGGCLRTDAMSLPRHRATCGLGVARQGPRVPAAATADRRGTGEKARCAVACGAGRPGADGRWKARVLDQARTRRPPGGCPRGMPSAMDS
jgi:hypothetical protein